MGLRLSHHRTTRNEECPGYFLLSGINPQYQFVFVFFRPAMSPHFLINRQKVHMCLRQLSSVLKTQNLNVSYYVTHWLSDKATF